MRIELQLLWVACGGSLGALARYGLYWWFSNSGGNFSWGTLWANLIGCFLAGWMVGCGGTEKSEWLRLCVVVGFLGAFTTFSTFGIETVRHLRDQHFGLALANVAANLFCSLAMVMLGVLLGEKWKC